MQNHTKILIADDDKAMRSFLFDSLTQEGFQVAAAEDGGDALSFLLGPNAPSFAILDWNMPVIDGISLCRKIRDVKDHGALYIIVITGGAEGNDVVAALDSGADDFLKKPFRKQELLARVRSGQRLLTLSQEKIAMVKQLEEQHRLESVGRLAAGIAHELNTPMQYIGDNTRFIQDSLMNILMVVETVRASAEQVRDGASCEAAVCAVEKSLKDADLEYLIEQIPLAVTQTLDGINHVTKIVIAMKEFANSGSGDELVSVDLVSLLETVVTVTCSEWKYVSDLKTDFSKHLPPFFCYPGSLSQALGNLIVNAANAVAEAQRRVDDERKGSISVSAAKVGDMAEIRIADTGCGIASDIQDNIMEPFFTTREPGRGMGQGLALARSVIVDKHGGTLEFETEENVGTVFIVRIPFNR